MPPIPQVPAESCPCADVLNERIRALTEGGAVLTEAERAELAELTSQWCEADRVWRGRVAERAVLAA